MTGLANRTRQLDMLCAAFKAELRRVTRRRRTWVFVFLAMLIGFGIYQSYSTFHVAFLDYPPPRLAMPGFGMLILWILLVGVVLLAFDLRHNDSKERLGDVLDSRSISNIHLATGRLLAIVVVVWMALLTLAGLLQLGGILAETFDTRAFGETVSHTTLVAFVIVDGLPALAFWAALAMTLESLLRTRLVSLVAAFVILAAYFWVVFNTPLYLLPVVSGVANLGLPGSDILPRLPGPTDLFQRGAILCLSVGLISFAAAYSPRPDVHRRRPLVVGGAVWSVVGLAIIGTLAWYAGAAKAERIAWADARNTAQDDDQLDVERIVGTVDIRPGRGLSIALDLHVSMRKRDASNDESICLILNPGMEIEVIQTGGVEASYSHSQGVVSVAYPTARDDDVEHEIHVRAAGKPDPRFAYVGNVTDAMEETLLGRPLVLLGDQGSLFDDNFVALMPGVHWLPSTCSGVRNENSLGGTADFRHVDLTVEIPDGWRIAGPGRRLLQNGSWQLRPDSQIGNFALIAAPFERRGLIVDGIEFEILVHPMHLRNIEHFTTEDGSFSQWLEPLISEAISTELAYPFHAFSMVEVPAQLRRYGGGWRLALIQAQPGVQLLSEHGFPTARFMGPPTASRLAHQMQSLQFKGPNDIPFAAGATRNLLGFLTTPIGEDAMGVGFVVEALVDLHTRGRYDVRPGHWLMSGDPNGTIVGRALARVMGSAHMSTNWTDVFPNLIQELGENTAFSAIDPRSSPVAHDVFIYKGTQVAEAVRDFLGVQGTRELLVSLRKRFAGSAFTVNDFVACAAGVDPVLDSMLALWFYGNEMPGFLVSPVEVFRLPDGADGEPRYQILVNVRNDESVPGIVRIAWRTSPRWPIYHRSPTTLIDPYSSVEIGVISTGAPLSLRLEPYLSLNRTAARLRVPDFDDSKHEDREPLSGWRNSDWELPSDQDIVIDDLDSGFRVVHPERERLLGSRSFAGSMNRALPQFSPGDEDLVWRRQTGRNLVAWGKYRRTIARIPAGDGEARAYFSTELPHSDVWHLDYHLPGRSVVSRGWTTQALDGERLWVGLDHLVIIASDGSEEAVAFGASDAVSGWNYIGTFDVPAGLTHVVVTNRTAGEVVVADAIRWRRESRR